MPITITIPSGERWDKFKLQCEKIRLWKRRYRNQIFMVALGSALWLFTMYGLYELIDAKEPIYIGSPAGYGESRPLTRKEAFPVGAFGVAIGTMFIAWGFATKPDDE